MNLRPPCKQAHGLTPRGWVHTKNGKPCKHMNAAHAALALEVENERLRETLRKIAESGVLGYSEYRDLARAALESDRG